MTKGLDCEASYSLTASWSTVRMLLVMAMQHGWSIKQADFDNAFVQAPLDRDVYVAMPATFGDAGGL